MPARERTVMFPVEHHDDAGKHAAQVSIMGNVVHGAIDTEEQLDQAVTDHHPLGLDGERERDDEHGHIGEQHTEGQQQAKHSARSADRDHVIIELAHREVGLSGIDHPNNVIGRQSCRVTHVTEQHILPRELPYQLLNQGGADAARDVVEQIALGAQHAFKQTAEHPQRKHVEEDVGEPTRVVHEHIGEKLGYVELAPLPEVETHTAPNR